MSKTIAELEAELGELVDAYDNETNLEMKREISRHVREVSDLLEDRRNLSRQCISMNL